MAERPLGPERRDAAPEAPAPGANRPDASAPGATRPAGDDTPKRERLHPVYMLFNGPGVALVVFFVFLSNAMFRQGGLLTQLAGGPGTDDEFLSTLNEIGIGMNVVALVIVAAMAALFAWVILYWRSYYYELGPTELHVRRGVVSVTDSHLPYGRIQSVDDQASLIKRLIGVTDVVVNTAGGAANTAVKIPCITRAQAEDLRRTVFAKKREGERAAHAAAAAPAAAAPAAASGAPVPPSDWSQASSAAPAAPGAAASGAPLPPGAPVPPGAAAASAADGSPRNLLDPLADSFDSFRGLADSQSVDTGEVLYERRFSNSELAIVALVSTMERMWIVLLSLVGTLGAFLPVVLQAVRAPFTPMLFAGIGAVIFAVTFAASFVGSLLSYGGYVVRLTSRRIEVERGLTKHQYLGIDLDRIQSIHVDRGIVMRLFGFSKVSLGRIESLDMNNENSGRGFEVHPCLRKGEVADLLAHLLPDAPWEAGAYCPLAKPARRRALVRELTWKGPGLYFVVMGLVVPLALAWAQFGELGVIALADDTAFAQTALGYANVASWVLVCLGLLLVAGWGVNAWLWSRDSGWVWKDGWLKIANRGLGHHEVLVARAKIQSLGLRSNPFQRRAGTVTLRAANPEGAVRSQPFVLVDLSEGDGRELMARYMGKDPSERT